MVTKIDANDVGENYMWHPSFTTSLVLSLKFSYSKLNINIIFQQFLSSSPCINLNVAPLTNANNKYKILQ